MTKAEIVEALYSRVGGFSRKESAEIVDQVFEIMKATLGHGEKIKISGFGNFVLRDKRQRPGRNPQTGDPIEISERRVLTFKTSQVLKNAINGARLHSAPAPRSASAQTSHLGLNGGLNGGLNANGGNGNHGGGTHAPAVRSSGAPSMITGSVIEAAAAPSKY